MDQMPDIKDAEAVPFEQKITLTQFHREAGKVKRWHTEFTVQQQTISDHVFNMIRIYTAIWGAPDTENFYKLIYHDIEEREIGDWPHWTACDKKLEEGKRRLERAVLYKYGIKDYDESDRIKICDWVEALEFMIDEVNLGNDTLRNKMEMLWRKMDDMALYNNHNDQLYGKVYRYLEESGTKHKYNCIIDGIHRG